MKLQPYPEYKDSGVPWLACIPQHWDCLPHRALFEEIKEQGHVDEPLLSVTIGGGIIPQEDLLAASSKKDSSNLDKSKYKLVEPGDIAYNKMRAWQGAVGVSRYRGIVSPAYIVQRVRGELKLEFFHYLFRTPGFAKEAEHWSYGITSDQWSLRPQHFKMIYSCVPPRDEQDAIILFLKGFDRNVRRFIRNRRRLIEVLNEQKQAIINRAVTRGLDPDVPLKSSGIDWLGEVPDFWRVLRAKYLLREVDVRSLDGSETHLSMSQKDGLVPASELTERHFHSTSYAGGKVIQEGDLVLNRLKAHLGVFSIARQLGVISPDYTVLRPTSKANVSYYELVLKSTPLRPELKRRAKGLVEGFWRLYTDDFYDIRLPVPPRDEQAQIVRVCAEDIAGLNGAVKTAEHEIDLAREYRTRLIADVVTGKVDVRHLAPPPGSEGAEEPAEGLEPLDEEAGELDEITIEEGGLDETD